MQEPSFIRNATSQDCFTLARLSGLLSVIIFIPLLLEHAAWLDITEGRLCWVVGIGAWLFYIQYTATRKSSLPFT